jgi:hypothetical protein
MPVPHRAINSFGKPGGTGIPDCVAFFFILLEETQPKYIEISGRLSHNPPSATRFGATDGLLGLAWSL